MINLEIYTLISELVLNFFRSINAEISEFNGLYQIKIPKSHESMFNKDNLKITFEPDVAKANLCELIVPGSNTLLIIMNECLRNGSVVFSHRSESKSVSTSDLLGIRFHFFVLFDGIINSSLIKAINVDYQTSKIIEQKSELIPSEITPNIKLNNDLVDYAYISAIDHLNKIMKSFESKYLEDMLDLRNTEFDSVNKEYQKKLDEIDDEVQKLRIKNNIANTRIENSVMSAADVIEITRSEQQKILQMIDNKYRTRVDYALYAAEVFFI